MKTDIHKNLESFYPTIHFTMTEAEGQELSVMGRPFEDRENHHLDNQISIQKDSIILSYCLYL